jgi:predicted cupin superfamily sugar epimerase
MKLSVFITVALMALGFSSNAKGGEYMPSAQEIIEKLDLVPLPEEGGYYRETYRSEGEKLPAKTFGIDAESKRSISTAIYYLVSAESFSAIHRIKSDEVFHYYAGDPVEMIQFDDQGNLSRFILGNDILGGETPQVVVPKGVWQALRLVEGGQWALLGTTVAPGFEFEDFEVGTREKMTELFPHLSNDIQRFTREPGQER